MTVRSKIQEAVEQLTPLITLAISFLIAMLIAVNVKCHSSLAVFLYDDMPTYGQRSEFHWLGATHGLMVYMFVPMWCGVIDNFKLSYRTCCVAAGAVQLLSCVFSTALADPGYLIITDSLLSGSGASVTLSVVILVIDDQFPNGSRLRILATTLVQGTAFATFFLVDLYSGLLKAYGWRNTLYVYGGLIFALCLLGCTVFVRKPRPYQPLVGSNGKQEEEEGEEEKSPQVQTSVIDEIHNPTEWKSRLLSLSQREFDSSSTIILWLLERLLAAMVADGMFIFLLNRSGIVHHPFSAGGVASDKRNRTMLGFLFSIGSTSSYLAGGFLGIFINGALLTAYMPGALLNICALVAWIAALNNQYHLELVIAWFCGFGVGLISTFAYAASEEATGVSARSIFPFTKAVSGVAVVVMEILHMTLSTIEGHTNPFILLVVMLTSICQFSLLVIIKSRLNQLASGWQLLGRRLS